MEQDLAHQDEQRNGREREAHHRHDAVADDLAEPRLAAEEQAGADDIDGHERERHRHAEKQEHSGAAKKEQRCHLPGHGSPVLLGPGVGDGRGSGCGHDAETASLRGARSAFASRCMRKTNSIETAMNAKGIGASSHHSGIMSVLIEIEPAR